MKRTQLSCLLHNDDKRQRKDEHCAPWHSNMEEIVLINLPYEILEQVCFVQVAVFDNMNRSSRTWV